MSTLVFLCLAQLWAAISAVSLLSGAHTHGGRNFQVAVPTSVQSAPVLICLHGNGGSGAPTVDSILNAMPDLAARYIIVGPDGPLNSWNIKAEDSSQDDQLYIGTTLIDHLATFDNVNASSFTLYGFSNGAALTNRILIENDDPRITAAITDGSQLNTLQYNNGNFYVGGPSNDYTTIKSTLTPRRLLQLVQGLDGVIPADGGASVISDGSGGTLIIVPWRESALAYATAYGYTGNTAPLNPDDATTAKAEYLSSQVQAYNFKQLGHVAGPTDALAKTAIYSFLELAGSDSTPNSTGECSASCSNEFLNGCMAGAGNTYDECRASIDAGTPGPLVNNGCIPGCTDTPAMAAEAPLPPSPPVVASTGPNEATVILVATVAGTAVLALVGGAGSMYMKSKRASKSVAAYYA